MTVAELISKLADTPPQTTVVVLSLRFGTAAPPAFDIADLHTLSVGLPVRLVDRLNAYAANGEMDIAHAVEELLSDALHEAGTAS